MKMLRSKNFNLFKSYNKYFCSGLGIKKMRAVMQTGVGGWETFYVGETDIPKVKEDEVLIKVEAFSLNRADLAQRQGKLIPQKGGSSLLGLECSGHPVENGRVNRDKKVMALVFGGAYAEYVSVKRSNVINVPQNMDVVEAAAIPEAWMTAYQLCKQANVGKGDYVMIHAAASGVGTALIQLVRLYEAESICLVGNDKKLTFCVHLGQGTAHGILRKDTGRINKILKHTHNQGCSVIMDCVGAEEFDHNLNSAGMDCRWLSYGFLSGSKIGDFDLNKLMSKRINLLFTTLRNRPEQYKTQLLNDFSKEILPRFATGELSPVIDTVFTSVEHIREAHHKMDMDMNIGKLVVKWH